MKAGNKNIAKILSLIALLAVTLVVCMRYTFATVIVKDDGNIILSSGDANPIDRQNGFGVPINEGYYCINHGAEIDYHERQYNRIEDYELNMQEAYIFAAEDANIYAKQVALWQAILIKNGNNIATSYKSNKTTEGQVYVEDDFLPEANKLLEEAYAYAEFYNKISELPQDSRIKIDSNNTKTTVEGDNYKIGPFKAYYIDGYENFCGITKATLQDNNGNDIYEIPTSTILNKEDFYITVPKSSISVEQVKLHLEYSYTELTNINAKRYAIPNSDEKQWQQLIKPEVQKNKVSADATSSPINLVMKISGYVFNDIETGKPLAVNGIKDSNEALSNVTVILCSKEANGELSGDQYRTVTASNGEYSFKDLPIGPNYYVKFVYNGHNYQPTIYNASNGLVNGNANLSYSSENATERDAFNARLATIDENTKINGIAINNSVNKLTANELGTGNIYAISAYSGNNDIQYITKTTENVNLGICNREKADIAVRKDVEKVELSIKGYSQTYTYDSRQLDTTGVWDISARAEDIYYNNPYLRDIRKADYNYSGENKLSAIVTYKIALQNQSSGVNCKVNSIYDWYDGDYTFLDATIGDTKLTAKDSKTVSGYKGVLITLPDNSIAVSNSLIIKVRVQVNAGENGQSIALDEDGKDPGKGNIAEIASYSTYYASDSKINCNNYKTNDVAGLIDRDSNPGNFDHIGDYKYEGRIIPNTPLTKDNEYEDDTDRAPFIKFQLSDNEREIDGTAWIDEKNKTAEKANIGDGIMQDNEQRLSGITVELWEILNGKESLAKTWNGTQWVEAVTVTSKEKASEGQYIFTGFTPGNYYVKFINPDGQTYKSTIYNYSKVNPTFSIDNPDAIGDFAKTTEKYSDARDLYGDTNTVETRQYVNNLLQTETNESLTTYNDKTKTNISVAAITGKIGINIEENPADTSSNKGRAYEIADVDFGLQERAKAQLVLSKEVSSVKVTLANGNVTFDANSLSKITNVMWQAKQNHTTGYTGNSMNQPVVRENNQQILLTMDKELMQGANINLSYNITVKNVGEVDYNSKEFYYLGTPTGDIVKTKINTVLDYPGAANSDDAKATRNNLQFDANQNKGWSVVSKEELVKLVDSKLITDVNDVKAPVNGYNTIIKYDFNKELEPSLSNDNKSTASTTLALSEVMSTDSKSDNLSYNNLAEIVSVSNIFGRKMQYSTVGNQNPDTKVAEVDADSSQSVTILPPFGQKYIYYTLIGGIAVLILAGIVLIKKYVIKGKKQK